MAKFSKVGDEEMLEPEDTWNGWSPKKRRDEVWNIENYLEYSENFDKVMKQLEDSGTEDEVDDDYLKKLTWVDWEKMGENDKLKIRKRYRVDATTGRVPFHIADPAAAEDSGEDAEGQDSSDDDSISQDKFDQIANELGVGKSKGNSDEVEIKVSDELAKNIKNANAKYHIVRTYQVSGSDKVKESDTFDFENHEAAAEALEKMQKEDSEKLQIPLELMKEVDFPEKFAEDQGKNAKNIIYHGFIGNGYAIPPNQSGRSNPGSGRKSATGAGDTPAAETVSEAAEGSATDSEILNFVMEQLGFRYTKDSGNHAIRVFPALTYLHKSTDDFNIYRRYETAVGKFKRKNENGEIDRKWKYALENILIPFLNIKSAADLIRCFLIPIGVVSKTSSASEALRIARKAYALNAGGDFVLTRPEVVPEGTKPKDFKFSEERMKRIRSLSYVMFGGSYDEMKSVQKSQSEKVTNDLTNAISSGDYDKFNDDEQVAESLNNFENDLDLRKNSSGLNVLRNVNNMLNSYDNLDF